MATPSLAMIPSAYADSKVYSVLPNNGDGDFTFNRDSSATRVGQNGLIQTVGYFGNDLVTNGDFSNGSTDWSLGSNWSVANGKASCDGSASNSMSQASTVGIASTTFKVSYDVLSISQGSIRITLGGVAGSSVSQVGSYSDFITATSTDRLRIFADSSAIASIDNIVVQQVTGDQPRLNYDISNGVVQSCPSLLLEPASTNLIAYSQDFSNYSTVLGIIAESGFTDPSGTTTAYKLSNFANNGSRFDYTTPVTAVNGTTYTYSAYYKGSGTIRINCSTSGGVGGSGEKDIVLTNEWKREEISFTAVNPTGNVKTHTAITRTANNNAIVYLAFTQIEALSYATSYIPTNGASQTRAAETCFGAGTASTFNSTEGTIYFEGKSLIASFSYNYFLALSDGTNANRLELRQSGTALQFLWRVGGVYQSQILSSGLTITNNMKFALKYSSTEIAFFINGVEMSGTIANPTLFPANTLTELAFDDGSGANPFQGNCKDIRVYNEALTDAQLTTLTT